MIAFPRPFHDDEYTPAQEVKIDSSDKKSSEVFSAVRAYIQERYYYTKASIMLLMNEGLLAVSFAELLSRGGNCEQNGCVCMLSGVMEMLMRLHRSEHTDTRAEGDKVLEDISSRCTSFDDLHVLQQEGISLSHLPFPPSQPQSTELFYEDRCDFPSPRPWRPLVMEPMPWPPKQSTQLFEKAPKQDFPTIKFPKDTPSIWRWLVLGG